MEKHVAFERQGEGEASHQPTIKQAAEAANECAALLSSVGVINQHMILDLIEHNTDELI